MHEDMATRLVITKEQASNVSIGDKVSVTVNGVVTGISENMSYAMTPMDVNKKEEKKKEPKYFDLELKKTEISGLGGNKAEKEYRKIAGKE